MESALRTSDGASSLVLPMATLMFGTAVVDVPGHAAVGELDADGVVQAVVVYPRYPAPRVAHEGARAVVGEGILTRHPVEVRGARVWKAGGVVAHAREHVALVRHVEVIDQFRSNSLPFIVVTVESIACPLYDSAFNLMVKYNPIRQHSCFIWFPFYFMKEKIIQQFLKPFFLFL